jgi:alpha-amylase
VFGFRIDAARHIAAADLLAIKSKVGPAYYVSEVASKLNPDISDYYPLGDVWEFSWVELMADLFRFPGGASYAAQYTRDLSNLTPSQSGVSMVTNHDTERSGIAISSDDAKGFELATIFTLGHPYAKPMLYSGFAPENYDSAPSLLSNGEVADASCKTFSPKSSYRANEWVCQHRWKSVSGMVAFRDATAGTKITDLRSSRGVASFGRENLGHLVINSNSKSNSVKVKTRMRPGVYCDLVSGSATANGTPKKCAGKTVVVDKSGYLSFTLPAQTALAIAESSRRS